MSLNVCPAATAAAPIDVVWKILQPAHFSEWIDGEVERITPAGPAVVGQQISILSKAFGRKWHVLLTIESIDPDRHQLGMQGAFPFGISLSEHISCASIDALTCRVQYG